MGPRASQSRRERPLGRLVALVALAACTHARTPTPSHRPRAPVPSSWRHTFAPGECGDLTLLVPFLEGIAIHSPAEAIPETGYRDLTLAYPGALSVPMIGWRCHGVWRSVRTANAADPPVRLELHARGGAVHVELACVAPCELRQDDGAEWRSLARAAATGFGGSSGAPLASRVHAAHYYVHDWIDASDPRRPRKTDWDGPRLEAALAKEPDDTLVFVYGLDPGGVDLEGRYLAPPADRTVAALRAAAPHALLYHWLNLRTYKYAIPALGIDRPPDARVRAEEKLYASGPNEIAQYSFRAVEMCTASAEWQASRVAELDRLIAAGFRVIALDEFPTTPRWDGEPCRARNHLHRPNDARDEWRITLAFVARLAERARRAGVLLGSEEPCTALLPYVSAYVDGTYDDPPEMYGLWMKSPRVERVPLFSTMFADRVTPMTRPDPKHDAPAPWLTMKKM